MTHLLRHISLAIAGMIALLPIPLVSAQTADSPVPRTTLSDRTQAYTVPESGYVKLRRGPLEVWIVDNRAVDDVNLPGHRAGYHGIAVLRHEEQPRTLFVPTYSGLNFEHIHDGTTRPRDVLFEPRQAPMELRVIDEYTVDLYQPPTPHWGLESCQRYTLLPDGTIELVFECIPHRPTWKNDYLGLFWASYIHQPESLDIHFLESSENTIKWGRGITPTHGTLATHRLPNDRRQFAHDADFPLELVFGLSERRLAEPWFFGQCRGMAFAQMFRPSDAPRFSQSPSGGGKGNPAWDFQWFISTPVVGKRYQFVMRSLYAPLNAHDSQERSRQQFYERRLRSNSILD